MIVVVWLDRSNAWESREEAYQSIVGQDFSRF